MIGYEGLPHDITEMKKVPDALNWYYIDSFKEADSFFLRLDIEQSKLDTLSIPDGCVVEGSAVRVPAVKLIRDYEYKVPETINLKGGLFPIPIEKRIVGIVRLVVSAPLLDLGTQSIADMAKRIQSISIDVNKVPSPGFETLIFPGSVLTMFKGIDTDLSDYMLKYNEEQITSRDSYIRAELLHYPDYWDIFIRAVKDELPMSEVTVLVNDVVYEGM